MDATNATMEIPTAVKPRRRTAVKTSAPRGGEKVKATIILPLETSRRLTVYATFTGADRSDVVARLIDEHLRRFVVSDRARPEAAGEV